MGLKHALLDKSRQRDYILAGSGFLLLTLGKIAGEFPLLVFLGMAPLLQLVHTQVKTKLPTLPFLLPIYIVFLFSFVIWNFMYPAKGIVWLFPIIYSLAALVPFVMYIFTYKYARNRLGLFTLVIYWLAMEYAMFMLHPEYSRFWLASTFNNNPHLISWNVHTGYLGVSLWILLVNIMFYRALTKNHAVFKASIHWPQIGLALALISIPFFFNTETQGIVRQDLLQELPAMEKQVSGKGEYIGKTALWVSLLMIIYSFVRRKINEYERT